MRTLSMFDFVDVLSDHYHIKYKHKLQVTDQSTMNILIVFNTTTFHLVKSCFSTIVFDCVFGDAFKLLGLKTSPNTQIPNVLCVWDMKGWYSQWIALRDDFTFHVDVVDIGILLTMVRWSMLILHMHVNRIVHPFTRLTSHHNTLLTGTTPPKHASPFKEASLRNELQSRCVSFSGSFFVRLLMTSPDNTIFFVYKLMIGKNNDMFSTAAICTGTCIKHFTYSCRCKRVYFHSSQLFYFSCVWSHNLWWVECCLSFHIIIVWVLIVWRIHKLSVASGF